MAARGTCLMAARGVATPALSGYGAQFGIPKGLVLPGPSGFTPPVSGVVKRTITKLALTVNGGGNNGIDATFTFVVKSPSARLRLAVLVFIRSQVGTELVPTGMSWSLQSFAVDGISGNAWPLQQAYPAAGVTQTIPDAAEFDSAVEHLRGTVNVPVASAMNFTGVDVAQIFVQAEWEPNVPLSDEERARLYSLCGLGSIHNFLDLSTTGRL